MASIPVTVSNFERAETHRMFNDLQALCGGINQWSHLRAPTPIESQTVIRMNRDTLYSIAIVDLAEGATLTIPDAQGRYLSVMVVNEDHYINEVFHEPGDHELDLEQFGTRYVMLGARTLVDTNDADDLAAVATIQDGLGLTVGSSEPFVMPDYETESFDAMRKAVLALGKGVGGLPRAFGARAEVDPIMHLIGTAAGWGGLPESEAHYLTVEPGLPEGDHTLTVGDVPVDAFWSISVYNADGFFEKNDADVYSVNSVTASRDADGSVTIHFGGDPATTPNSIPVTEGWSYVVRLYQPRPEILDGTWVFPSITAS